MQSLHTKRQERSISISFIIFATISIIAMLAVLMLAISVIQNIHTKSSIITVEGAISSQQDRLNALVSDNSWWNDAIVNILINYSQAWAEQTFKKDQTEVLGLSGTLALKNDYEPIFHYLNEKPLTPDSLATLLASLRPLLQAANNAPLMQSETNHGFVIIENQLFRVSVSAFTPENETYKEYIQKDRGYLVFLRKMDSEFLRQVSGRFHLNHFRFVKQLPTPSDGDYPFFPVHDPYGNTLGYLTWLPPNLLSQMTGVFSLTFSILLLLIALGTILFRKLSRHVSTLETELTNNEIQRKIIESKHQTLEKIACSDSTDVILEHLAIAIEEAIDGVYCVAFLFDRNTARIKNMIAPSLDSGFVNALKHSKSAPAIALHDKLSAGSDFSISALREEPTWAKYLNRFNISFLKSAWSTPILSDQDRLLGGVLLYRNKEGAPTDEEQSITRSNAEVTGVVLEKTLNSHKLELSAYYDPVTNLVNRQLFRILLERAIQNKHRQQFSLALITIDIDRFKHINDTLGNDIADRILSEIADRISMCVRQTDTVARVGGDEFAVLITNPNTDEGINIVAEKIAATIKEPIQREGKTLYLTASMGIATDKDKHLTASELTQQSELALTIAKDSGRDQYHFYDAELDINNQTSRELKQQLSLALDNQELSLVYLPIINLKTFQVTGIEALLRWNNSEFGQVPPQKFIPLMDNSSRILEIGEYVLNTACQQLYQLRKEGFDSLTLSINLAAKQFRDAGLIQHLKSQLDKHQLTPEHMELDISENLLMQDYEKSLIAIRQLREAGFSIAIDDFGSGALAINHLHRLPVNKIKIDRPLIANLSDNTTEFTLTSAIIAMAKQFNFKVLAEGLEKSGQYSIVKQHECQEAQGYYFSKPLQAESLVEELIVLRQKLFEFYSS